MDDLKKEVMTMIDRLDRKQLVALHQYLDRLQDPPENPGPAKGQGLEELKHAQ